MPRRHYSKFPPEFQLLTDRAIAALKAGATSSSAALFRVDLKTAGNAINVQMQVRQYWASLAVALERGEIDEFDRPMQERAGFAGILAIRCASGSKTVVEIVHRSQLRYSNALAEALGTAHQPILAQQPPPRAAQVQTAARPPITAEELDAATAQAPAGKAQSALLDAVYGKTTEEPKG